MRLYNQINIGTQCGSSSKEYKRNLRAIEKTLGQLLSGKKQKFAVAVNISLFAKRKHIDVLSLEKALETSDISGHI